MMTTERSNLKLEFGHPCVKIQKQNKLLFSHFFTPNAGKMNMRHNCVELMVRDADSKYNLDNFDETYIFVSDFEANIDLREKYNIKFFGFFTENEFGLKYTCPDFNFHSWFECGYNNYDLFCKLLYEAGKKQLPENKSIIWRGCSGPWGVHNGNNVRKNMLMLHDGVNFDFIDTDESPSCAMSLPEQIIKSRYFIDAEGCTYSGRVKLLLFSQRVLFLVDRKAHEFYYPKMIPWVHYVPVKQDLSDLVENFEIIKNDEKLEKEIINNATDFAYTNLTYSHALWRWLKILNPNY